MSRMGKEPVLIERRHRSGEGDGRVRKRRYRRARRAAELNENHIRLIHDCVFSVAAKPRNRARKSGIGILEMIARIPFKGAGGILCG